MRAADYAADRDSAAWGRARVSPFPLRGLQRPAMGSREDRWREMILRQGYSAPPLRMAFSAHPACRQGRVLHHSMMIFAARQAVPATGDAMFSVRMASTIRLTARR